jgi:pyridoxine/pyridoxamine 5'-phosphate oxidase
MPHRNPAPSRPDVPDGYGITSDPSDAGAWDDVARRIAASRNYWIASTRPDGRPHVMPVWGIWLDGELLFATDRVSRKGRNVAANPRVVVHLESGDDVVIVEGVAHEETSAELLSRYTDAYDAKYAIRPDPSDPATVTYALRPSVAFSWTEADYPNSATRWSFPT